MFEVICHFTCQCCSWIILLASHD